MGVRVNQPELLDAVADCIPFRAKRSQSPKVDYLYSVLAGKSNPDPGVRHYHLLYVSSRRLARTFELPELMATLRSHIPEIVAHGAKGRVLLRAGAVAFKGKALLLPGRSPGIASLVGELVRAGGEFYSDRFVQLDADARLRPDPFPAVTTAVQSKYSAGRDRSRNTARRPGIPVALIAFTESQPDGAREPRNVSPGQALFRFLTTRRLHGCSRVPLWIFFTNSRLA